LLKSGTLRGADLPNPAPEKVIFVQKRNHLNQPLAPKYNLADQPLALKPNLPGQRFAPSQASSHSSRSELLAARLLSTFRRSRARRTS